MALDIPNLAPNTPGEAGNLYNALSSGALENVIKGVQAQYAPLTTMSEAASKLAYSNLMGPQFLAKLMGHPDIAANLSPEQRQNALQSLYGAGNGQMSGNALLNNPNMMGMLQPQQQPGFLSQIRNLLGGGQQQPNQMPMNALAGQMQNQMPPQMQSQGMPQQQQMQPQMQQQAQPQNQPMASAQQPIADQNAPSGNANDAWYENAARAAGIEAEGKELGGERGKAMTQLGHQLQSLTNVKTTYDNIKNILTKPEWQNMRNSIPLFQDTQLNALAKVGTPEQQQLIGQFLTNSQSVVRDTLNSFSGSRLKGELPVSQNMKVGENDTINVALGKLQASDFINDVNEKYISTVHDLMKTQHLDEEDAYEQANKIIRPQLSGIREKINGFLPPVPAPGAQSKASQEQVSPAAKNLAKTMDLSRFQSPQEFQTWYAQQPELTQQAVRLHMKQRG